MSRLFLSHSSKNNAAAIALRDWLLANGWGDLFLDVDPRRGLVAGQRWEKALQKAAHRCEAVIFIVSKDWLNSQWCRDEFNLAHHLGKRLFGVLIEDIPLSELPEIFTRRWQLANLAIGDERTVIDVQVPPDNENHAISFADHGLISLKEGLKKAGLDAKYFTWPPEHDLDRPPYRGLKALQWDDAGIFFGRDGSIIEALDQLRGLRESAPPRALVILGASGAGKSSFMMAGLLPRLARDDRNFAPLPVVRPGKNVLSHPKTGLIASLEEAFRRADLPRTRAEIRAAVDEGATTLGPLLTALAQKLTPQNLTEQAEAKPPLLILPIDQGEELFLVEGARETAQFLSLLRDLLLADTPALIVLFTIRSDRYENLQTAKQLEGVRQHTLSLPPMPKGTYGEVIKGPAARLTDSDRALDIKDDLVEALLSDIEEGGAKDALPLLAFTLERLYNEHGGDGDLILQDYEALGRIKGSIEAAVNEALTRANDNPKIPRDHDARLALLRRGLIPWIAGIDPDTGKPRRRVAKFSDIPDEARPLMELLVEQRLLATDVDEETGEKTIEPAHESLLRQWDSLQGWLVEDTRLLSVLDGVKRAARDWSANVGDANYLSHGAERLKVANSLAVRSDLAAYLTPFERDYLTACNKQQGKEKSARRRMKIAVGVLGVGLLGLGRLGYGGHLNVTSLEGLFINYPYNKWREFALKPGDEIKECSRACPQMVVIPVGNFLMGSKLGEGSYDEHGADGGQVKVTIPAPLLVSKFEVTFAQWDACVEDGACGKYRPDDFRWGRGQQPVFDVSWVDVQRYLNWLSRKTGNHYRLLSEAEWEYAARAGTNKPYSFEGSEIELEKYAWFRGNSGKETHPVGELNPNAFGLHDMHGNVGEWVEDCYHRYYKNMPDKMKQTGSPWVTENCAKRGRRGGSWHDSRLYLRSAYRTSSNPNWRNFTIGFRVARTLR